MKEYMSHYVLDNKYVLQKKISSGGQATIMLAEYEGRQVAVKLYVNNRDMKIESQALLKMDHDNIVKILAHGEKKLLKGPSNRHQRYSFIVMDFDPQSVELFQVVTECQQLSENEARVIFRQLVSAVEHIHSRGYAHRDIKLENVLINSATGKLKLIDFGYAIECPEYSVDCLGTQSYMAPEVRCDRNYDARKSDVFSLGVILYSMVQGTFPFEQSTEEDPHYQWVISGNQGSFWTGKLPCSEEFQELVWSMLSPSPGDRPSITDILKHAWTDALLTHKLDARYSKKNK